MKNLNLLKLTILAILFCFCAIGFAHEDAPDAQSFETVTLQLKWKHQFQSAGYYMAIENGHYREAGLNVVVKEAEAERGNPEIVLSGDAEFGVGSSNLVLNRARGEPIVALAAIFQHSPSIFIALPKFGVETVHDLAGKRVMVEAQDADLLAYLEYEGIPPTSIQWLPHTYDVEPLLNGEVAAMTAYSTDEPFVFQELGIDYRIFTPRSGGIDFYGDTLFTTEALIEKRPQLVEDFLDASLRGWADALNDPDTAIDLILSEYSQRHSREHLEFEARRTKAMILPDVVEIGYMNPGRWEFIAEQYRKMGMMKGPADLGDFLYNRDTGPDLRWVYAGIVAIGIVLFFVILTAYHFYRLNRVIRNQVTKLETLSAHLRGAEKRYRSLAENAPIPIAITRLSDNSIRYLNPKAAEMLRVNRDYAIGKNPTFYYHRPEDREEMLQTIRRQGYIDGFVIQMKDSTGRVFWVAMSATLIDFEEHPSIFVSFLDMTEQKELEGRLHEMAMSDHLTGLMNRRHFIQRFQEEIKRANRHKLPLTLIMGDLDHFKQINDTLGHAAGDEALKRVAETLQEAVRDVDLLARLGGEEFGIILPNTNAEQSRNVAERIRAAIEELTVEGLTDKRQLTISLGIAEVPPGTKNEETPLKQADDALYNAKSKGRNTIIMAGDG